MKWPVVKLGVVADVESGFGFPRDYQGDKTNLIPFFKVGDMNLPENSREMTQWTNTVSANVLKSLKARTFPAGTVIFPKIGAAIATGKKRILTCDATFDNNVMGLVPTKLVEPRFLYYWSLTFDFTTISNIGPVPSIRKTTVESLAFPLPPLSEQRRIVEILDQADDLRTKRAEADAKIEAILTAVFYTMFGDPSTNPKRLRKQKLRNFITVRSGNFLPAKSMSVDGIYPVYGGNGINGYHSKYMFEDRVIIIGRVGAYCGVIHYSSPKCWVTDNALYIDKISDGLRPKYLVMALKIANLNQYAGRAGQPLISGSRIYPVEILVPQVPEQERFSDFAETIEQKKAASKVVGQSIDKIFAILLQRAFSGNLTAKWRESHMNELLAEMEEQAKYLATQGTHNQRKNVALQESLF